MALSISNLVRKDSPKVPIICIYGGGGLGKSTLASEFPNSIWIQTEDGANGLGVTSFTDEPVSKYSQVDEALTSLATEDHDFKTLVVDSITKLEPIVWAETKLRYNMTDKEFSDFTAGARQSNDVWAEFMSACQWLRDNKGMTVILIGHDGIKKFNDPTGDSYDRYAMRLYKDTESLIREQSDVVGFMNQITTIAKESKDFGKKDDYVAKGRGSGQRALHLSPRPSFMAKQRPGYNFPDMMLINVGSGYEALAPYLPTPTEPTETKQAAA